MKTSITFLKCKQQAMPNEDLMPVDCLDILKENYGGRLEWMRPTTIYEMIYNMMALCVSEPDENEIIEVVNNYIND